jgi:hypothetical protein
LREKIPGNVSTREKFAAAGNGDLLLARQRLSRIRKVAIATPRTLAKEDWARKYSNPQLSISKQLSALPSGDRSLHTVLLFSGLSTDASALSNLVAAVDWRMLWISCRLRRTLDRMLLPLPSVLRIWNSTRLESTRCNASFQIISSATINGHVHKLVHCVTRNRPR